MTARSALRHSHQSSQLARAHQPPTRPTRLLIMPLRLLTITLALVASPAVPAGASAALVTPTGHVGPLRIDRSTRAQIIHYAGTPATEVQGSQVPELPYDELGYHCRKHTAADNGAQTGPFHVPVGTMLCRTAYFINTTTGKLVTFFTSTKNFVTNTGVRVGTTTARAERRLGKRLISGCGESFYLGSSPAMLIVADSGGHGVQPDQHVVGGHIAALVLHSRRHDVGFFDCL